MQKSAISINHVNASQPLTLSRRGFLHYVGVGFTAAGGLLLASCAPANPPTPNGGVAAPAQAPLRLRQILVDPKDDAWKALLTQMKDPHPEFEVEIISTQDVNTTLDKLTAQLASGAGPDFAMSPIGYHEFAFCNEGMIKPLDDYLQPFNITPDDFQINIVNAFRIKGQLRGLPLDVFPMAAFYNKDHFDEAGIDFDPILLDATNDAASNAKSFFERASSLPTQNSDGSSRLGFYLPKSGVQSSLVFGYLATQMGARYLNEDESTGDSTTKTNFTDTEAPQKSAELVLKAFEWLKIPESGITDAIDTFSKGNTSILWATSAALASFKDIKDINWRMTSMPQFNEQQPTLGSARGMFLFNHSDPSHVEASVTAITWLSQNSEQWIEQGYGIPIRNQFLNNFLNNTNTDKRKWLDPLVQSMNQVGVDVSRLGFGLYTHPGIIAGLDEIWLNKSVNDAIEKLAVPANVALGFCCWLCWNCC